MIQAFKLLFAIALITWLVVSDKIDFASLGAILDIDSILICWAAVSFSFMATALRWTFILQAQQVSIRFWDAFRLTLISTFFNFVLPGGVTGDAVKAYYISKTQQIEDEEKKWRAGTSVLIDRYVGVTALCLISYFVTLFDPTLLSSRPQILKVQTFLGVLLVFLILVGVLLFSEERGQQIRIFFRKFDLRYGAKAKRFFASMNIVNTNPRLLIQTFGLSLMSHFSILFLFVHVGSKIEPTVPLLAYLYCTPIALMLSALPLAPGGIGVGQAAFYFIFNLYLGRSSDLGPTLVTLYQFILFTFGLMGAFFYLRIRDKIHQAKVL